MSPGPNVAVRVDGSPEIGTGHVMRCLTLADGLAQRGARIRFVAARMPDHLQALLAARGHACVMIDGGRVEKFEDDVPHAGWLGHSQAADARSTAEALMDLQWHWLIVDHYALDARWESALRGSTGRIMVIDDLADRAHDCDVLLDQNLFEDMNARYVGLVPAGCRRLLGPQYLLLREEFRHLRTSVRPREGRVRRILIFFGGADFENNTSCAIETVARTGRRDISVDVVIGAQHPLRTAIEGACAAHGFACHVQTERMAELMAAADLAIGACGFVCYEFAAMLLPAILLPTSPIQAAVSRELAERGVAYDLGPGERLSVDGLMKAWDVVVPSDSLRSSMSRAAANLTDLEGVQRACSAIEEFGEQPIGYKNS